MKYKVVYLVLLITVAVAILTGLLSAFWNGFLVMFGIALIVGAVAFSVLEYFKHRDLKENIYQKRYVDAYKYADEHGEKLDVANFKYPKKQETEIRRILHDSFVLFCVSILLCLFCVFVFVFICTKTF